MNWERDAKNLLAGAIILTITAGLLAILIFSTGGDTDSGDRRQDFHFMTNIDSRNSTLEMTEPNRTVNWREYLIVVNGTYIMKSSSMAVPGVSTSFVHDDWLPVKGCCYDVEVVERDRSRPVWNGSVEASR
ncbi:MAG: hypothetical protein ACMUHB_05215 [Thermoplasmatota archaeon]